MSDEHLIRELLEEILDSGCSPEEACRRYPELLGEIRERLERLKTIQGQIDVLFPPSQQDDAEGARDQSVDKPLPRLEGYELDGVLGRGGVGVVYRARHLKLKRDVALKMLLSGAYASPLELQRFVREAEAVAGLQHPHIVQVHDVGEFEGRPYFTMELVEGGSLAQQLAGSPLGAVRSAKLVAQIAEAMEFAHQHGILHRDLKPGNILMAPDGTPKITDFGLARRLEGGAELTQSGTPMGTPSYMAPEQARGETRGAGPAVDIYSLGAILYELLTGRPPFRAETAAETVWQVVSHEPATPSHLNAKIPRDLETICLKCLNKEPQRRYLTAAALAEDLERFVAGQPILARPLSWGGRIGRWCRRNPVAAVQAAIALALMASITGAVFWLQREWAEQREVAARQEGRAWQAIEAALDKAAGLQEQGRCLEARMTLDSASTLLRPTAPAELRARLQQARVDANMVAELDEIRLSLSDGKTSENAESLSPERLYEGAFAQYGIPLMRMEADEAAAKIRESAISETLLAFLHDWLHWVSDEHREKLLTVVDLADPNEWRREFRKAFVARDAAKLKALAVAPEVLTQPPVIASGLGGTMLVGDLRKEALAMLRETHQSHPSDFYINLLLGNYWLPDNPQEAIGYFRAAVAVRPSSDQAYVLLGKALRVTGDIDGAIDAFRQAMARHTGMDIARDLVLTLAARGRLTEARDVWEEHLAKNPVLDEAWYGYAQLCLFLGDEPKYLEARSALLKRYWPTPPEWMSAERSALASLLLPSTGSELQQAVELADQARMLSPESDNPYVAFVRGFAKYRQGQLEQALPLLKEAAGKLPNRPGPGLLVAMTQFRMGQTAEARRTLSTAMRRYNWNAAQATHATVWVSHVLRREAERLMLPELPAFLEGRYQPKDNDERLSYLGTCQFQGLHAATTWLYSEAFAADPQLADQLTADCLQRALRDRELPVDRIEALNSACRYLAARSAALAGHGVGKGASQHTEDERRQWRSQAREWLRADLTIWSERLQSDSKSDREAARKILLYWQSDPDLAGLRDPDIIKSFSSEELSACLSLWTEVADRLRQQPPK